MLDYRYQYIDPNQSGTPLGFGNITPNMGKQWVRSYLPSPQTYTAAARPSASTPVNTALPPWQQYTVARPQGILANNSAANMRYNSYVGQFNHLTRAYNRTGDQKYLTDLGNRYNHYQHGMNILNQKFSSDNSPTIYNNAQGSRTGTPTPSAGGTSGGYQPFTPYQLNTEDRYQLASRNAPPQTATPSQLEAMGKQDPDLYQLTLDYQNPNLSDAEREELLKQIRYRLTQNNDITFANIIRGE